MKKGFTLAEAMLSILMVGILFMVSIPLFVRKMDDPNRALYRAAYSLVEIVANEMNTPFGATFCTNFTALINTAGTVNCATSTIPDSPNFITSNGMRWYGLDNTTNDPIVLHVDINGAARGPNTIGSDILTVNVSKAATVSRPTGGLEEQYHP